MGWFDLVPMPWRGTLFFLALWAWQTFGFAMVLLAGRRPLVLAPLYGLAIAGSFWASLKLGKGELWWFLGVAMVVVATGMHFLRHIKRAMHCGPYPRDIFLDRKAVGCAIPVVGPVCALLMVAQIKLVRWRDRLDYFDR